MVMNTMVQSVEKSPKITSKLIDTFFESHLKKHLIFLKKGHAA